MVGNEQTGGGSGTAYIFFFLFLSIWFDSKVFFWEVLNAFFTWWLCTPFDSYLSYTHSHSLVFLGCASDVASNYPSAFFLSIPFYPPLLMSVVWVSVSSCLLPSSAFSVPGT